MRCFATSRQTPLGACRPRSDRSLRCPDRRLRSARSPTYVYPSFAGCSDTSRRSSIGTLTKRFSLTFTKQALRGGGGVPYLAVHLFEERLAPLVELLVVAHQLQLLHRKVVEALGDLLHIHLVVALYGEGHRLGRPLGSRGRGICGVPRSVGHRPGRRT